MVLTVPGPVVAHLFDGWEETLIWSALEGIMGSCHALTAEDPRSALIVQGDFFFLAGIPEPELLEFLPTGWAGSCRLLTPQDGNWSAMIEGRYGAAAEREIRYAIRKEPDIFCREHLQEALSAAPAAILPIDEARYHKCLEEAWSRDLVNRYESWEHYSRLALGFVAMSDGQIISGASCYSTYSKGIEIEIDTHPDHRRKGLAYGCGAALILECLDRGLYPSWDAANPGSVALAEKLGYHFSHEYPVYYLPIRKE